MKSLMLLWQVVANEYGDLCGISTGLDFKTVELRVKNEGLSFLTITLPQFCKDTEMSLANCQVDRNLFQGFSWKQGLPRFLGGFLGLVFDRATGRLLDKPNIEAIRAIRQLTLLYSKVELEPSARRVTNTIRGFIECEQEVKRFDLERTDAAKHSFRQVSDLLWGNVLSRVNEILYEELNEPPGYKPGGPRFIPKHGPGATADRLVGNNKFDQVEWPRRLEEIFSSTEFLIPNWRYFDRLSRVDILEPGAERPVRVITVPKTMKTPRLIAIEPTAMQYVQQGIKDLLVPEIINDKLMGSIVGFTDQEVNRLLAREGSLTKNLATLDLSEASDRVSNQLVREMLQRYPLLFEAVDSCRSRKADVPGHGVIRLAKFASMGSALTFPIEAMVFATVVFLGIQEELNRPLTKRDVESLRWQVRVYGDDIIVPTHYVPAVVRQLEAFGFRVNSNKSFWSGNFRESCGREYFNGEDVSVVKVRQLVTNKRGEVDFPARLRDVRRIKSKSERMKQTLAVMSLIELRNRFYAVSGLWTTAAWLDKRILPILDGYFPNVEVRLGDLEEDPWARSKLLGRFSFLGYQAEWTDRELHSPMVKGYVVKFSYANISIDDVGALHKIFTTKGEEPFADVKHLERSGRPDAVYSLLRWASPF